MSAVFMAGKYAIRRHASFFLLRGYLQTHEYSWVFKQLAWYENKWFFHEGKLSPAERHSFAYPSFHTNCAFA